jgi:hypothetical protein
LFWKRAGEKKKRQKPQRSFFMKRSKVRFSCATLGLALLCAALAACAGSPETDNYLQSAAQPVSPEDELDAAIRESLDLP